MGFSGVVFLIPLSVYSTVTLSSVCVGSLVVLGFLPVGGSFVGGFSPAAGILAFTAPTQSTRVLPQGGQLIQQKLCRPEVIGTKGSKR